MIRFSPDSITWNRAHGKDEILRIVLDRVIPEHREVARTHPKIHEHASDMAFNLVSSFAGGRSWTMTYSLSAMVHAELPKSYLDQVAAKKAAEEAAIRAAEAARIAAIQRQQAAAEAARQAEIQRQQAIAEAARQAEIQRQQAIADAARQAEVQRQQAIAEAARQAEIQRQQAAAEAARQAEEQRIAAEALLQTEIETAGGPHQVLFAGISTAAIGVPPVDVSRLGLFAARPAEVVASVASTPAP